AEHFGFERARRAARAERAIERRARGLERPRRDPLLDPEQAHAGVERPRERVVRSLVARERVVEALLCPREGAGVVGDATARASRGARGARGSGGARRRRGALGLLPRAVEIPREPAGAGEEEQRLRVRLPIAERALQGERVRAELRAFVDVSL